MLDFVQLVRVSGDRPVIDKTGITGEIDYEIEYSILGSGPGWPISAVRVN